MHRRDFFVKGQSEVDSRLLHDMLKGFVRSMLLSLAITMTFANPARAASPGLSVPDDVQLLLMIKTTLIAFNQANITGNYTVLRDLAAPDFQMRNTPARLGEIFQSERSKNFDLSPVVLLQPELVRRPVIDQQGRLHIEGVFPSRPQMVHFVLVFQNVMATLFPETYELWAETEHRYKRRIRAPSQPFSANRVVSAIPATAVGSAKGMSMIASNTRLPGNS